MSDLLRRRPAFLVPFRKRIYLRRSGRIFKRGFLEADGKRIRGLEFVVKKIPKGEFSKSRIAIYKFLLRRNKYLIDLRIAALNEAIRRLGKSELIVLIKRLLEIRRGGYFRRYLVELLERLQEIMIALPKAKKVPIEYIPEPQIVPRGG